MSFGRETALRAGAGVVAVGIAWTAVAFFALGVYQWLLLYWGTPGAAFGATGVCALLAGGVVMIALRGGAAPVIQTVQQPASVGQNANLVMALKELSVGHPLLAVCAAAVLGAVGGADKS